MGLVACKENSQCSDISDIITISALANSSSVLVRVYDGDGHEIINYSVPADEPIATALNWRQLVNH